MFRLQGAPQSLNLLCPNNQCLLHSPNFFFVKTLTFAYFFLHIPTSVYSNTFSSVISPTFSYTHAQAPVYETSHHNTSFKVSESMMLWLLCGNKIKCSEMKECPCAKLCLTHRCCAVKAAVSDSNMTWFTFYTILVWVIHWLTKEWVD